MNVEELLVMVALRKLKDFPISGRNTISRWEGETCTCHGGDSTQALISMRTTEDSISRDPWHVAMCIHCRLNDQVINQYLRGFFDFESEIFRL